MRIEVLKKLLVDNRGMCMSKPCDVREYSFEDNTNYILYGIRRSGKSAIMCERARILNGRGVSWDQIFFIDFSDEKMKDFVAEEFDTLLLTAQSLSPGKSYFFFDEISRVDGWEDYLVKYVNAGALVFAAGSDGSIHSKETQEKLGSDFKFQEIYTYNFKEYLLANKISFDAASLAIPRQAKMVEEAYNDYTEIGGFPCTGSYLRKRDFIDDIFQNDIIANAITHNDIRYPMGFRLILKKMAENIGTEIAHPKLHSQVAAAGTVLPRDVFIDYVEFTKKAFVIFSIGNHYAKVNPEKNDAPKYFFTDVGLLNLMIMNNDLAIMKNLVAIQLKRKYGNELEYYKSGQMNVDIDFYLENQGVAVIVTDQFQGMNYKKGMSSFEVIRANHPGITRFIVLTKDHEEAVEHGQFKVEIAPIRNYLLQMGVVI